MKGMECGKRNGGRERARCRKGEEDEQHVREGRERREVGSGREAMGGGAIGGCGGRRRKRREWSSSNRGGGQEEVMKEKECGEVMANKIQTFGSICRFGFIS